MVEVRELAKRPQEVVHDARERAGGAKDAVVHLAKDRSGSPRRRRSLRWAVLAGLVLGAVLVIASSRRRAGEGGDGSGADTGDDALIDLRGAADRLHVPEDQVEAMVDQGLLTPADPYQPRRFHTADVEAVRLQGG